MIANLPVIKLPASLTQICSLELRNNKACYSEIILIIESDAFLSLFVPFVFEEYSQKGGLALIFSSLGWQGFRNRLAEAYLHYARHGHFPKNVKVEEVKYAIEFERRYEFLYSESNSRAFLLGLYLKLCEIDLELNGEGGVNDFSGIPYQVDEILAKGRSKSLTPDWLIVIVWSFYNKFGKAKCLEMFKTHKGNWSEIMHQVSKKDYGEFIMDLLVYGHAINDTQIFTDKKV